MLCILHMFCLVFFQAEDGIRDLVRSRGLGDVYKRQGITTHAEGANRAARWFVSGVDPTARDWILANPDACLLYTSDAAAERSSVDLGGRRIIKKKQHKKKKNTKITLTQIITAKGRHHRCNKYACQKDKIR